MISKCTPDHVPLTAFSSSVHHQETVLMIVRNIHDKEALDTTYIVHGGAIARMILEEVDIKIFRKDVAELLAYVEKVLTIPHGQRGERAFK
jgi:hypothetical protein